MTFDVDVGNPPYQQHVSARPDSNAAVAIFGNFVYHGLGWAPRAQTMIVAARWITGGKGNAWFLERVRRDRRLRKVVHYPDARMVFPPIHLTGGCCYMVWGADEGPGTVEWETVMVDGRRLRSVRRLDQYDVIPPDPRMYPVLAKVVPRLAQWGTLERRARIDAWGIASNFYDYAPEPTERTPIALSVIVEGVRTVGWVGEPMLGGAGLELANSWKVLVPRIGGTGYEGRPVRGVGAPQIAGPPSVYTNSWLGFPVRDEDETMSLRSYLQTRVARYLVLCRKATPASPRFVYRWVPEVPLDREWTDAALVERFGLDDADVEAIYDVVYDVSEEPVNRLGEPGGERVDWDDDWFGA